MLLSSVYIRTSKSIQGFVVIRLRKLVDARFVDRWSLVHRCSTAERTIGIFLLNLSLFLGYVYLVIGNS